MSKRSGGKGDAGLPRKKSKRGTLEALPNSAAERFGELVAWARDKGGQFDETKIEISNSSTSGYHIRAVCSLLPDTRVMSIPKKLMLTWPVVQQSHVAKVFASCGLTTFEDHSVAVSRELDRLETMDGQDLLADIRKNRLLAISSDLLPTTTADMMMSDKGLLLAFLIHARSDRTNSSSHGPYARTLPDAFQLPLTWDEPDLQRLAQCILGHNTLRLVAAQTAVLVHDFCTVRRHKRLCDLLGFHPSGTTNQRASEAAYDQVLWASSAVTSRIFGDVAAMTGSKADAGGREEFGIMVPLFDLFNHDPLSAHITFDAPHGIVHKCVEKGEQIISHYGADQSNANLLVSHGFAQWDGPHDSLAIGWSLGSVARTPEENPVLLEAIVSTVCSGGDKAEKETFSRMLVEGGVIKDVLTHAKPFGDYLVKIANAVALSLGNGEESVTSKAQAYLMSYLHGKRDKLLQHLEQNYENKPWENTVARARGRRECYAVFGTTTYATTIETSVIAFYDGILSVLEHSIELAEAGELR
jgi:hypothetical protein